MMMGGRVKPMWSVVLCYAEMCFLLDLFTWKKCTKYTLHVMNPIGRKWQVHSNQIHPRNSLQPNLAKKFTPKFTQEIQWQSQATRHGFFRFTLAGLLAGCHVASRDDAWSARESQVVEDHPTSTKRWWNHTPWKFNIAPEKLPSQKGK